MGTSTWCVLLEALPVDRALPNTTSLAWLAQRDPLRAACAARLAPRGLPGVHSLSLVCAPQMLVHFPASWSGVGGKAMRQAQWRAMEAFAKAGKARSIGISHYCRKHLDDVLEIASIAPAVNQVQYHVGMGTAGPNATDDKEYMLKRGVTYESFSPLCGPCDGADRTELISGKLVTSIGAKYGKTGAQVALKWQVQQGIPVIPKSSNPTHIAQNLDLFSWTLSDEDMAALTAAKSPPVAGATGPAGEPTSGDCDIE